jgi:outer membrane biogenesis lipoprotein LolB
MKKVYTNEEFDALMNRKRDNINEVNDLIDTSEWKIDYSEYDEQNGYAIIVLFKKLEKKD